MGARNNSTDIGSQILTPASTPAVSSTGLSNTNLGSSQNFSALIDYGQNLLHFPEVGELVSILALDAAHSSQFSF